MLIIVTGPPCAGKTTWVDAHAHDGDIIIDYDRIAQALTKPGGSTHDHGRHLKGVAYRARAAAVTEALRIAGYTQVYVIHTDPAPDALRRYQAAGAEVVTLDPGYDVAMARAREQRPPAVAQAVERWYRDRTEQHDTVRAQGSRQW